MPVKIIRKHHVKSPKHKHTKPYLKAYWPYIPILLISVFGLYFGGIHTNKLPRHSVLSYTIDAKDTTLLQATNAQRNLVGQKDLTLNAKLNTAAQNKANDMVARNYWSHETPDGQQPWLFIKETGYLYNTAGENLAYGFSTSKNVIYGWMNSQTHKDVLLSSVFTEVGFGFAKSANFGDKGPQTIIVAFFGQPSVETIKPTLSSSTKNSIYIATTQQNITKAQELTKGKTPWISFLVGIITALGLLLLLLKHSWNIKLSIKSSRKFLMKHPLFDLLLLLIILAGFILSTTTGVIK